jgi:hypothetical protein
MKNNFNAIMTNTFSKDDMIENGGWHHPVKNGKLYITKNNISIVLDEDEIKKLAKAIGANFKRG